MLSLDTQIVIESKSFQLCLDLLFMSYVNNSGTKLRGVKQKDKCSVYQQENRHQFKSSYRKQKLKKYQFLLGYI